ncbi:MAG: YHS domain-containing protein [Candidatus Omnitrophica bacterium]|nr:YHS domain-containing protein [Candidatus Omnitrophota bacterium]
MKPHKVTYKGKIYNLCCSMCEKDFNKDPEKYTKLMEAEVAAEQGTPVGKKQ